MKSIHTPLGRIRSNKKFIAGAAALALVGGITPALISNSNAAVMPIYTTVGPDFFTIIGYNVADSDTSRVYVEDTSIADFYDEDWRCSEDYSCLQGKKTGRTNIVVERNNNDNVYIPLTSVTLNSNAYYAQDNRTTVERTASITGASNDLLTIYSIENDEAGSGSIERTGSTSYRISSNDIDNENTFDITWHIGDQEVGGGTEIVLRPFEAHDLISHNEANEDVLRKAAVSLVEANEEVTSLSYSGPIEDRAGNIASGNVFDDDDLRNFTNNTDTTSPYAIGATMTVDEYLPESEDEYNYTVNQVFGDKEVTGARFFTPYAHVGNCVSLSSGADYVTGLDPYDAIAVYDDESGRVCMNASEIKELAEPVTITLDTAVKPVKDGYERTWFVYQADDRFNFSEIDSTYDENEETISFETTTFTNFAVGFADTEIKDEPTDEPTDGPTDEPKEDTPAVPNTGSSSKVLTTAVATFLPLMMIAGLSFIARAKKRSANKLAKKHNHFE